MKQVEISSLARQKYFTKLGLRVRPALLLHRIYRLWGQKGTRDDWRNVTTHCLVEAARAKIFADLLGFSKEVSTNLITAAALHDYNKRSEVEVGKGVTEITWESTEETSVQGDIQMRECGIPDDIIVLVNAVAHTSFQKTAELLEKGMLSEEEVAYLVMHYIDDYTIESTWAEDSEIVNGKLINALDKRIAKNKENAKYRKINEKGFELFGVSTYDYQLTLGKKVEAVLAGLIRAETLQPIVPQNLPCFIDNLIKEETGMI